eukprot:tig00020710_g13281.t1
MFVAPSPWPSGATAVAGRPAVCTQAHPDACQRVLERDHVSWLRGAQPARSFGWRLPSTNIMVPAADRPARHEGFGVALESPALGAHRGGPAEPPSAEAQQQPQHAAVDHGDEFAEQAAPPILGYIARATSARDGAVLWTAFLPDGSPQLAWLLKREDEARRYRANLRTRNASKAARALSVSRKEKMAERAAATLASLRTARAAFVAAIGEHRVRALEAADGGDDGGPGGVPGTGRLRRRQAAVEEMYEREGEELGDPGTGLASALRRGLALLADPAPLSEVPSSTWPLPRLASEAAAALAAMEEERRKGAGGRAGPAQRKQHLSAWRRVGRAIAHLSDARSRFEVKLAAAEAAGAAGSGSAKDDKLKKQQQQAEADAKAEEEEEGEVRVELAAEIEALSAPVTSAVPTLERSLRSLLHAFLPSFARGSPARRAAQANVLLARFGWTGSEEAASLGDAGALSGYSRERARQLEQGAIASLPAPGNLFIPAAHRALEVAFGRLDGGATGLVPAGPCPALHAAGLTEREDFHPASLLRLVEYCTGGAGPAYVHLETQGLAPFVDGDSAPSEAAEAALRTLSGLAAACGLPAPTAPPPLPVPPGGLPFVRPRPVPLAFFVRGEDAAWAGRALAAARDDLTLLGASFPETVALWGRLGGPSRMTKNRMGENEEEEEEEEEEEDEDEEGEGAGTSGSAEEAWEGEEEGGVGGSSPGYSGGAVDLEEEEAELALAALAAAQPGIIRPIVPPGEGGPLEEGEEEGDRPCARGIIDARPLLSAARLSTGAMGRRVPAVHRTLLRMLAAARYFGRASAPLDGVPRALRVAVAGLVREDVGRPTEGLVNMYREFGWPRPQDLPAIVASHPDLILYPSDPALTHPSIALGLPPTAVVPLSPGSVDPLPYPPTPSPPEAPNRAALFPALEGLHFGARPELSPHLSVFLTPTDCFLLRALLRVYRVRSPGGLPPPSPVPGPLPGVRAARIMAALRAEGFYGSPALCRTILTTSPLLRVRAARPGASATGNRYLYSPSFMP